MIITKKAAQKVLKVVDAGLVSGLGYPVPGHMCVEAAVCYALGLPHGDSPACVAPALRSLKIALNDARWSSPLARAKGLRKLAVLQLGTAGVLDEAAFATKVAMLAVNKVLPPMLRQAGLVTEADACAAAATLADVETATRAVARAAWAAKAAVWAAWAAEAAGTAALAATEAWTTKAAIEAARTAAWTAIGAANTDATDTVLATFAEDVSGILIEMQVPGVQWLDDPTTANG